MRGESPKPAGGEGGARGDVGARAAGAPPAGAPPAAPPPAAGATLPVPPPELVRAATLFFKGRYRETVTALEGVGNQAGPAGVQAQLFRSASLYALFLTGGEQDVRLREASAAAVRECRRLDPGFSPDPAVFSPRFIGFYRQVR
jgi:hypothetical protein